jgi:hypothetical protein
LKISTLLSKPYSEFGILPDVFIVQPSLAEQWEMEQQTLWKLTKDCAVLLER